MSSEVVSPQSWLKVPGQSSIRAALLTASVSRQAAGIFAIVRALSGSLIDCGCDVHVFGGKDAYSGEDRDEWGQTPVTVMPTIGPRAFGFQRGLMNALSAYKPDVLHVHGLWMYPSIAVVRWAAGSRPYVVSPHGMLDSWAVQNSAWKKRVAAVLYENAHLRGAACIHVGSDAELAAIRAYGLRGPAAVIPNGVDLPNLSVDLPPPGWATQLPAGAKVVLFLGRLHPKKGLVSLLQAWAQCYQRQVSNVANWQLVIAGWDQVGHQTELKRLAFERGVERSVHFVGPQFGANKEASLKFADAFILPSQSEGLPMAVLEAWSYKLPVLMTPECNLSEGFVAGAAIRVLPQVESLADGLAKLFEMSKSELHSVGDRGRELVARQFVWEQIAEEMANVYRWTLDRESMPESVRMD